MTVIDLRLRKSSLGKPRIVSHNNGKIMVGVITPTFIFPYRHLNLLTCDFSVIAHEDVSCVCVILVHLA